MAGGLVGKWSMVVVLGFSKNPGKNMFEKGILPVDFGQWKDKFSSLRK